MGGVQQTLHLTQRFRIRISVWQPGPVLLAESDESQLLLRRGTVGFLAVIGQLLIHSQLHVPVKTRGDVDVLDD